MRRIFVGDIQGCREELERLLAKTRFDPASDRLHPVGDLVNRGPDSLGTLRLLIDLGAQPVLGNHDLHLLRAARGTRRVSARDTLGDCLTAPDRASLLGWLARQPFVRVFDDAYLVHAGLHPAWDDPADLLFGVDPYLQDPRSDFATRVRWCSSDGTRPRRDSDPPDDDPAAARFSPWFEHYPPEQHAGRKVVFGHWAKRGRVAAPGLRGLDTGCVWGGRLTAWIAEEERFVDVAARRTYCRVGS